MGTILEMYYSLMTRTLPPVQLICWIFGFLSQRVIFILPEVWRSAVVSEMSMDSESFCRVSPATSLFGPLISALSVSLLIKTRSIFPTTFIFVMRSVVMVLVMMVSADGEAAAVKTDIEIRRERPATHKLAVLMRIWFVCCL